MLFKYYLFNFAPIFYYYQQLWNIRKTDIIQCEQDVNKVIIDSNFDASMKQELQGTNSLAAKTTIFWKTVKKEYE